MSNHDKLVNSYTLTNLLTKNIVNSVCFFSLQDERSTLFLIAGYGRYNCPYVWVRSNHDRLVKLTGTSSREKDCPLKLKTTLKWKDTGIVCFLSEYKKE